LLLGAAHNRAAGRPAGPGVTRQALPCPPAQADLISCDKTGFHSEFAEEDTNAMVGSRAPGRRLYSPQRRLGHAKNGWSHNGSLS